MTTIPSEKFSEPSTPCPLFSGFLNRSAPPPSLPTSSSPPPSGPTPPTSSPSYLSPSLNLGTLYPPPSPQAAAPSNSSSPATSPSSLAPFPSPPHGYPQSFTLKNPYSFSALPFYSQVPGFLSPPSGNSFLVLPPPAQALGGPPHALPKPPSSPSSSVPSLNPPFSTLAPIQNID